MKILKKMAFEFEHYVFERLDIFLQNMGMTVESFFGERTLWAREHRLFREKSKKKGHFDFF